MNMTSTCKKGGYANGVGEGKGKEDKDKNCIRIGADKNDKAAASSAVPVEGREGN